MYAETFNVRTWLETPAKWLRWAMQSLGARNLTDVQYNLQQFWTTLAQAKSQARTQQDWSEVLTLDAQSQWTLGSLYQGQASDVLKKINTESVVFSNSGVVSPLTSLQKQVDQLNQKAKVAFDAQVQLADQASQAADAAKVQSQAAATVTVGRNAQVSSVNDAKVMAQEAAAMGQSHILDDLKNTLSVSILGLPLWTWLAGGTLLLILLTTAPAMAEAAAVRRAVEE